MGDGPTLLVDVFSPECGGCGSGDGGAIAAGVIVVLALIAAGVFVARSRRTRSAADDDHGLASDE